MLKQKKPSTTSMKPSLGYNGDTETEKTSLKKSPKPNSKSEPLSLEQKKDKARWARIFKVYGITREQYEELDTGGCPICLRDWSPTVRPCVDHDHATGDIRGLLCIWCNRRAVGRFRDHSLVQRIADYLRAERRGWIAPPKPKKKRKKKVIK